MGGPEPNTDADPLVSEVEAAGHAQLEGLKHRDLQTIVNLQALGGDITVPRHLLFYFYFPEKSDAKAAGRTMRRHGFSVTVHKPWERIPQWAVVAERHNRAIVPDFLRETNLLCVKVAARHDGEYDGWEAGLTKGEKEARKRRQTPGPPPNPSTPR